jgi:tripartite-type tricarboxylate transporter receptor subunit TctC
MRDTSKRRTLKALGYTLGTLMAHGVNAANIEKFPTKSITLIAPWPAGGGSDALVRTFAESASRALGVSVVVENKPGAGGTLGATAMVNAKPDGYTLTQLPLGVYRLPHMQKMPYDPVKDLTHIIGLTGYTFGIVSTIDAPFKTIKEMVAYARANPGMVEYGSTGTGTTPHLAMEEFSQKAGIVLNHIPYKGSAELMQAILGGQIRVMCGIPEFAPWVKEGKLRLLATLGQHRTKAFPDVPTVHESGWDTISESPFGIGGPKNMPPEIVQILHNAFKTTLEDPKVLELLDKLSQPVIYMNSDAYTRYAKRTTQQEKATIERLGMANKTH